MSSKKKIENEIKTELPEPTEPRQCAGAGTHADTYAHAHAGAGEDCEKKDEYAIKIAPYLADIQSDIAGGCTEGQLYKKYGVGKTTFAAYKKKYPELAEAIAAGRKTDKAQLVNKAHQIAMGYDYSETTTVMYYSIDDEGNEKVTGKKVTTVTRHAKADAGIMQFLLINRFPRNADNADGFARDPQILEIRRELLELKKKLTDGEGVV